MSPKTKLNLFTGSTIILGLCTVTLGFLQIDTYNILSQMVFFVIMGIISESFIIQVREDEYLSTGFAVGLAAILTLSPPLAAVVGFLGTVLKVYKEEDVYYHIFNSSFYKRVFNGSAYAFGAYASCIVYNNAAQAISWDRIMGLSLISGLMAVAVYVTIHVIIFSVLYAIIDSKPVISVLSEMKWIVSNFIGIAPMGVLMAIAYQKSGWFIVFLILGPLLLARYSFKLYLDMKQQYFETIKALSNAIEAKDQYTNGHSMRVADFSIAIGKEMGLTPLQLEVIKTAALLHDIGKIGIPDAIINKPSKLEIGEFYTIQRHPEIGENILKDIKALKEIGKIVRHHHERFDGNGYPDSLIGDAIPLESAIITVADAYDAMTSDRVYRKALFPSRAIEILQEESGRQYHPMVVEAFMKSVAPKVLEINMGEETC